MAYTIRGHSCLVLEASRKWCHPQEVHCFKCEFCVRFAQFQFAWCSSGTYPWGKMRPACIWLYRFPYNIILSRVIEMQLSVYHVLAECLNCVASFGNSTNFLKLGCFVCKISNFPIPVGARKNNLRWLAGMHKEEVRARNKKKSVVLPLCEQGQASAILHWKSVIAVFVIVKYLFPKL